MADSEYDEYDDHFGAAQAAPMRRWVHLGGAACSLALVIGVAIWGYKLAVRDVNGIPVVRALEGPLRVAPENPGGDIASHQGLSVNAVAAVGTAAPLPETVILAPTETLLASEDAPGMAVLDVSASALPEVAAPPTPSSGTLAAPVGASLKPIEITPQEAETLEEPADIAIDEPLPETQQDAVAAALAAALAGDDTLAVESDMSTSPRPLARPTTAAAAPALTDDPAAAEVAAPVSEIDATTIPAGTRLVQLGAFDDEAGARAEWAKLQTRFAELIGTKSMVVQSAQSGGRTFYRLRAHGFANEDETRRFCAALLAENASCIAVAQR